MARAERDGPAIDKMRRDYTDYASGKVEEIREARDARRYYHGSQWSREAVLELNKRKQPIVTYNRINRKIDGVVGVLERLRQDPKAFARNPDNEQGAELATSVMRYALDVTEWDEKESECIRKAGIEGIGCLELTLESGDHGDPEIGLDIVDPDTFYYDPRSFRADFSDARYMGVAKWMDLDVVKEQFPDHEDDLTSDLNSGQASESASQVDRERRWMDIGRKRMFLVEHWYKKGGGWSFCIYAGNVILAEGVSPFVDEKNQTMSRYLPWSAYVDHEGDRYGFVRNTNINATSNLEKSFNERKPIVDEGIRSATKTANEALNLSQQNAREIEGAKKVADGHAQRLDAGYKDRRDSEERQATAIGGLATGQALTNAKVDQLRDEVRRALENNAESRPLRRPSIDLAPKRPAVIPAAAKPRRWRPSRPPTFLVALKRTFGIGGRSVRNRRGW